MSDEELSEIIARLRAQGTDDARVEAKSSTTKLSASIWDSVSAFANTQGGTLLLGVSEEGGFTPVENFAIDKIVDQFVSGIGDGGDQGRLVLPPTYEISRAVLDEQPILVIRINENDPDAKPCYVKAKGVQGGSYKRVDDKDVRLSSSEIFELQTVFSISDADFAGVPETSMDDLDEILVDATLSRQEDSRAFRGTSTDHERLTRINVLKKNGQVTLAGLLVFGRYPQQFYPRLFIDVTVHPTNEKSSPTSTIRFVDRVQCDGPLTESIDSAIAAVQKNLRTHSVIVGSRRTDQLEIPIEVIREAIANAIVHRQYGPVFLGQPITVDVYPDRVEITNPGGLWGGKTISNIADGTSRCRNPRLMQLLQITSSRSGSGYPVEGQGSGVRLMINEMEAAALDQPRFRIGLDQFVVVLTRHGAEIPEHRQWLHDLVDRDLTPHEDAALVIARRQGAVSVSDLRSDLHVDSDDARMLLTKLEQEGVLRSGGPESYELASGSPLPTGTEAEVLRSLSVEHALSIHEISEITQRTPNSLRPILRNLIADGWATATAPPTSKRRRYLAARLEK